MNYTQVHFFTLTAYFDVGRLKYLYFVFVLCLYSLVVGSNLLLIVVICVNRSLHQPMYLFLCSLFVNGLHGSTGLFPLMLIQILSDVHTVPALFCFLQIFCIHFYGSVEIFTLSAMSYDRYVAICWPLHYNTRMSLRKVSFINVFVWLYSVLMTLVMLALSSSLRLCGNAVPKVYCDNYSVVKLACSDSSVSNVFGLSYVFTVIVGLVLLIVYSYVRILMVCYYGCERSRRKALRTCTPHLASLLNFSCGAFFEIAQGRFDMSGLPNMLRIFLSLYWLTGQPLVNPVLYGLNLAKIRIICKSLALSKRL